jgi:dolichol-phosphate mannosyltransferase
MAGLKWARGKGIVVMDADFQDPPELLPEMIRLWPEGHRLVLCRRLAREKEVFYKRFFAWGFYRFLNFLSPMPMPSDVGE